MFSLKVGFILTFRIRFMFSGINDYIHTVRRRTDDYRFDPSDFLENKRFASCLYTARIFLVQIVISFYDQQLSN